MDTIAEQIIVLVIHKTGRVSFFLLLSTYALARKGVQ